MAPLPPAVTATTDQWLAAMHDGEDRWPYNGRVETDPAMEALLLAGRAGPAEGWDGWQTLNPGEVFLLWPTPLGVVVPCPPGEDIAQIASDSYPAGVFMCERCDRHVATRAVVLSAGCVLVGVCVCYPCADDLETVHGPIFWTEPNANANGDTNVEH